MTNQLWALHKTHKYKKSVLMCATTFTFAYNSINSVTRVQIICIQKKIMRCWVNMCNYEKHKVQLLGVQRNPAPPFAGVLHDYEGFVVVYSHLLLHKIRIVSTRERVIIKPTTRSLLLRGIYATPGSDQSAVKRARFMPVHLVISEFAACCYYIVRQVCWDSRWSK